MRRFPNGTDLRTELEKAMDRLRPLGISYPSNYLDELLDKYSAGINYPRVLMRIGEPRIRKHPHYRKILERGGDFLDYGCGTGDDIRALIKDGYPRSRIKGFDIDWNSINIGFDLYRDREPMQGIFVVSTKLPFSDESFDIVYSGSVLHTIEDRHAISLYLTDACRVLRDGGVFFGSTLGAEDNAHVPSDEVRRTLLTEEELRHSMEQMCFTHIEIVKTDNTSPANPRCRLWLDGIKGHRQLKR
jgi:ubiquinone/menaquinone biosynthesis C-methylase UbiE